ncbi:hypothetical protein P8452_07143 [Trifolium repens]|nr:hypothetical protein P8452_07143 [Trifolium repens]
MQRHTGRILEPMLLQDHIGGLQVLHKDIWIDVPPLPEALVVNIGEFMQIISNDKFKSARHRVLSNVDLTTAQCK